MLNIEHVEERTSQKSIMPTTDLFNNFRGIIDGEVVECRSRTTWRMDNRN